MSERELAKDFEPVTREAWLAIVAKALKGEDFEKRLVSHTIDGLRIEPLYTRDAVPAGAAAGLPGEAPFTRGRTATPPAGGWDIRQLHVETEARRLAEAVIADLEGGVTSLSLRLEAPGQIGLPPRAPDLAEALASVDLAICPIALEPGDIYPDGAGLLLGLWGERKIAATDRKGAFNADPLGTLAATGALYHPIGRAVDIAVRLVDEARPFPDVTALLADGRPYHDAGASEAQELAAMLATLVAYLRAGEARGLAPEDVLAKTAVALSADADQFLTIAKLRAARRLVWRIADAAAAGPAAAHVRLAATTSWRMLAKRDPWVNMLRTTIACAAAAMAGADSITVLPFTHALGRADAFARRIARNTQLVLQEESSLGRVADPAGGSWYVETLTDTLAHKAWALFQDIERQGGMASVLESGRLQDEIATTAAARARDIARGKLPLTGSSAFPRLGDDGVTVTPWPSPLPVNSTGATTRRLVRSRLAEPFEALRDAADRHAERRGAAATVFLANLGTPADFTPRATWTSNFLAAGGIAAPLNDGFATPAAAADAFKASGASMVAICSSDEVYARDAVAAVEALKAAGARHILFAGRPGALAPALEAAGMTHVVAAGMDAVTTLGELHRLLAIAA
ncbi:MAG: methylmalonyl-CoA mutase family protein [Hyphomicrobiaceae bacterium]